MKGGREWTSKIAFVALGIVSALEEITEFPNEVTEILNVALAFARENLPEETAEHTSNKQQAAHD